MGIGEKLRQSSKGRLSYERKWPDNEQATKELLEEWTSPPKLSPAYTTWRSAACTASPGYSVRDGIIHMKTSTPVSSRLSASVGAIGSGSRRNNSVSDRRIVVLKNEEDTSPSKQQLSSSPDFGRSRVAIQEYEDFWDRKAKEAVELRRETFKESSRQLEIEQRQGLIQTEVNEYKKWENVQRRAEDQIKEQTQEIVRNLKRLKDTQENRKKFLDGAVQTVQGKRAQLEEEAKQHQLEVQKRSQTLAVIHSGIRKTREDLTNLHKSCLYKQHLPNPAAKLEELLGQLKHKADSIVEQARASEASVEHIHKLHQVYQQAQNALEHLTLMVENANKKGEEEKAEAERQKALAESQQRTTATPTTTTTVTAQETGGGGSGLATENTRAPSVSEELDVAPEKEFEEYVKLQENLAAVETSLEELMKNPQTKQYRFNLQKCVNTPVNAISPVSGEHLRDKLLRLCKLLGGNPVEIGNKRVSAKDHPHGISFCKHLLAKMIVKKAEEQVSSIHESAFAIAMVTVGVWVEHPDLGSLLLARFHAACPYLVPYYVPQLEGQSNEEHLQAQGYKFVGGVVEKQDKFLKRMSGVMRLYAALMLSSTPRSASVHPYGIEHAWKWLTNVMNMKPHPDITATLIYDLLEVTGHALYQTYNKQFQKLLHYLLTVYMPKIHAAVMSGGPVARLQNFLENCVKLGGRIPPPEGLLQQSFWHT